MFVHHVAFWQRPLSGSAKVYMLNCIFVKLIYEEQVASASRAYIVLHNLQHSHVVVACCEVLVHCSVFCYVTYL